MAEELPILPFVMKVKTEDLRDWKTQGIPATGPGSPYLGYYVCVGPVQGVTLEQDSNQQVELNFTGAPGAASGLYYALTFQLLKWQYNVMKIDEWIEVSPTHREYYERTIASKGALEGTIKEGLRSAAQAVADYELLKHDLRKYKEMMNYFMAVELAKKEKDKTKRREKLTKAEHSLKSMFVDQVDIHTGAMSLVEMARSRWPTVISDFYALTEEDDTVDGIKDRLKISKAEAVVLKTKNTLFREWIKLFGDTVKERFEMLNSLVTSREKSIKEYRDWIKPHISRYKALKVGHERAGVRGGMLTSFADLTGQATFGNFIRMWAFKPYRAIEYRKVPAVKEKKFTIEPYDKWAELFIKDPVKGLASIYPWLLNKGKSKKGKPQTVADNIVDEIKARWESGAYTGLDPTELYYIFFDAVIERLGLRLQVGELEDITFTIKTWVLSQNIMLVKLVERECRERELERYIDEILGIAKDEKPIEEYVKGEYPELFGKTEEKSPSELKELSKELREGVESIIESTRKVGKAVGARRGMFVKPGPYETDFTERITKQYLIPSGRMLGSLIVLLLTKMGVG